MEENIQEPRSRLHKGDNYHETRVDSSANIPPQGVPALRVEEVPEIPEVMADEEFSCPVIEPWIELMDD